MDEIQFPEIAFRKSDKENIYSEHATGGQKAYDECRSHAQNACFRGRECESRKSHFANHHL